MLSNLSTLDDFFDIPSYMLHAITNTIDIHKIGSLLMQEFHEIFPFDDAFLEVDFLIPTYSNAHDNIPFEDDPS